MPRVSTDIDPNTLKTVFRVEGLAAEFTERLDAEVVAYALEKEEVDPVDLADRIIDRIEAVALDELGDCPPDWGYFLGVLRPDVIDIIRDVLRAPK